MLADLTPMGITGKAAQEALDEVGIVLNKNMIPFDKEKPMVTSGCRIGTPCVTTRGMEERLRWTPSPTSSCGVLQQSRRLARRGRRSKRGARGKLAHSPTHFPYINDQAG